MFKGWLIVGLLGAMLSPEGWTPPDGATQVQQVLQADPDVPWPILQVTAEKGAVTVCVQIAPETLRADECLVVGEVEARVRQALTPLSWTALSVQAIPPEGGACRPLSDYLGTPVHSSPTEAAPVVPRTSSRSLAGKTVYVSAGHGWQWTGWAWRTQRGVYQEIIEDHNNAEAVDQYLIPYLEHAGATVIPVRERDWNPVRLLADNEITSTGYTEAGAWITGTYGAGYRGGRYRFATTVTRTATATATWTITVPVRGSYALYAWVYPGRNRAPDAHYVIYHAAGSTEVTLNQQIHPTTWRYLGTYPCDSGAISVTLDNHSASTHTVVIADALRLGGGMFDALTDIETSASAPPNKPWWESAVYYYSQWVGLDADEWAVYNGGDFNDVVARPMFARWQHKNAGEDAVYISWHTNGFNGGARGTESYVHNGDTYTRTEQSLALQNALHTELIHDIRAGWDAGWTDRGKKQANLGELRLLWDDDPATRMPGTLFEIAFHDQPDDAAALKDPRFEQLAARALYQGLVHYFEARDGVDLVELPEPPTHLRAQNVGSGRVRIAWSPSPTDTQGLLGDAANGYRLYVSRDGFAWGKPLPVSGTVVTLTDQAPGTKLYIRVTAVNDGGESFPTEVLGVRVGMPSLLIVNGFDKLNASELVPDDDPVEERNLRMWLAQMNRRDYVVAHGDALPDFLAWDSASNEAVQDGSVSLTAYPLVDWLLGRESTEEDGTLNAAERAALSDYLASGGDLLLSGSELAWDLDDQGRDPDFLHEQLHVAYRADSAATHQVTPTVTGAFAGLGGFAFGGPSVYLVDSPDVLSPTVGATVALSYSGGITGAAAIQYQNGCQRTLVFGFPLETIPSNARRDVMARAVSFLGECLPHAEILSPQAGGVYSHTPAFSGLAAGNEITRVEVQIRQAGRYWDGAQWGASTWLTASGVSTWTSPLPPLADGLASVLARPITTQSLTVTPWITFTFDATPPSAPQLLDLPNGESLTLRLVTLRWRAPADLLPLHYQVEVDGAFCETDATLISLDLSRGTHVWRVRAIDAAGNVGPWSERRTFTIVRELHKVFLPLLLRSG